MAINLFETNYIPTIFLRNSELLAVKELPESTKDKLTPIFNLKPWSKCEDLSRAIAKIEDVYGDNRKYFLDLDPFFEAESGKRPAHDEFLGFRDEENGPQNWIEFLELYPNASPCLQIRGNSPEALIDQVTAFTEMDRPFLVKLCHGDSVGKDWSQVVDTICQTDHINFGFVIDLEWGLDQLSRIEWADRLVKQIVNIRGDSIPICINGSSFPRKFTDFEIGEGVPILERIAFNEITSKNNQARIIYGDWASSRPPSEPIPIKHGIPPRIDLPYGEGWNFFRVRNEEGGFKEAAIQAMRNDAYPHDLDIWGTLLIASTANDVEDDPKDQTIIRSGQRAAAVRINIHIYRQQFHEDFDPAPDTDDEFFEA